jgi:hypothetical protein
VGLPSAVRASGLDGDDVVADDLPFTTGDTAPNLGAPAPRSRCRRHYWITTATSVVCGNCGKTQNLTLSRRGKNNRSRGNAIERWVCQVLRISRVGMFGGKHDGGESAEWMVVQVKSGGSYPERIDGLLRSLTPTADQLRAVVHTDAPGPGRRRRSLITLDLLEFAQWYGSPTAMPMEEER